MPPRPRGATGLPGSRPGSILVPTGKSASEMSWLKLTLGRWLPRPDARHATLRGQAGLTCLGVHVALRAFPRASQEAARRARKPCVSDAVAEVSDGTGAAAPWRERRRCAVPGQPCVCAQGGGEEVVAGEKGGNPTWRYGVPPKCI